MALPGTDPESYITESSLVNEDETWTLSQVRYRGEREVAPDRLPRPALPPRNTEGSYPCRYGIEENGKVLQTVFNDPLFHVSIVKAQPYPRP